MQPKLKENPREWQKFTGVMGLMAAFIGYVLYRRGVIASPVLGGLICLIAAILVISLLRPAWFRGFYRAGMTVSFHIGQVMGKVMLTLFFLLAVTPLGLLLRLLGKDLLHLKRSAEAKTYWQKARPNPHFDRMF